MWEWTPEWQRLHEQGESLERAGDVAGALAAYRRAVKLGGVESASNLGALLHERGEIAEAEEALRRADAAGSGTGAFRLGTLLADRGDPAAAADAYRRAASRGSGAASYHLGLLLARQDLAAAATAFEQAIRDAGADSHLVERARQQLAKRAPGSAADRRDGSPDLPVPAHILRPGYLVNDDLARPPASWIQPEAVIEPMRAAGRVAARALRTARTAVVPGATTDDVNRAVHEFLVAHDAYPSVLGYRGFPKSCTVGVNDVICHGIPGTTVLGDGDIVGVEVTAYLGGVHVLAGATFPAGDVTGEDASLVEHTHAALLRGIGAIRPGRQVNVIGRVIESYARRRQYGVVRDFTGHTIGQHLHNERGLVVHSYDEPTEQAVLEPGMTFTVQPMFTAGSIDYTADDDGWTVRTTDRSRSAHFGHTVLVTASGVEILTE